MFYKLLHKTLTSGGWWYEKIGNKFVDVVWQNELSENTVKTDYNIVTIIDENDIEHLGELDWSDTKLTKSDSNSGWVDRAGRFYPCEYFHHDIYAELVLKSSVKALEKRGWARLWDNTHNHFICDRRLTAEQRNTISQLGYIVLDTN